MGNNFVTAVIALTAGALTLGRPAQAQHINKPPSVIDAFGSIQQKVADRAPSRPVSVGSTLSPHDWIRTGPGSALLLETEGGQIVRVGESSVIELSVPRKGHPGETRLLSGNMWEYASDSGKEPSWNVRTPTVRVVGSPNSVFAVSYELESGRTTVSTNRERATVSSLRPHGWQRVVPAGRFIIDAASMRRSRSVPPTVALHNYAQIAMWRLIQTENWTPGSINSSVHMNRHAEHQLSNYSHLIRVIDNHKTARQSKP